MVAASLVTVLEKLLMPNLRFCGLRSTRTGWYCPGPGTTSFTRSLKRLVLDTKPVEYPRRETEPESAAVLTRLGGL